MTINVTFAHVGLMFGMPSSERSTDLFDRFNGLSDHFMVLFCSTAGFVYMVC